MDTRCFRRGVETGVALFLGVLALAGNAQASPLLTRVAEKPVACVSPLSSSWLAPGAVAYWGGGQIVLRPSECRSLTRAVNGWRPSSWSGARFDLAYAILILGHEQGHSLGFGLAEDTHSDADVHAHEAFHLLGSRLGIGQTFRRVLYREVRGLTLA